MTGRDGQLGRSLAERAGARTDIELIAVGRADADLADPDAAARLVETISPVVVVNTAAYTAVDLAESERTLAMRVNGEAPGALARAARRSGARLIQLSTDYVFDGGSSTPYREDDAVAPINVYGATKLAGEQAVAAGGAPFAILRTAWVYSPFGRNFLRSMLAAANGRTQLSVVADQFGNPTSALDLADAILHVIDSWRTEPDRGRDQVYHLAGTGYTHWAGFADTIFAAAAETGLPTATVTPIPTHEWPTAARRPARSILDTAKFARDFAHRLPSWQSSVRAVVARLAAERATP